MFWYFQSGIVSLSRFKSFKVVAYVLDFEDDSIVQDSIWAALARCVLGWEDHFLSKLTAFNFLTLSPEEAKSASPKILREVFLCDIV